MHSIAVDGAGPSSPPSSTAAAAGAADAPASPAASVGDGSHTCRVRREARSGAAAASSRKPGSRSGTSDRKTSGSESQYEGGHSYTRGKSPCMCIGWQLRLPWLTNGHCAKTHEHSIRGSTSVRLSVSAVASAACRSCSCSCSSAKCQRHCSLPVACVRKRRSRSAGRLV